MRRAIVAGAILFVMGCPSAPTRRVEIGPTPTPSAPPAAVTRALAQGSPPAAAAPIHSEANASWASAIPASPALREVVAPDSNVVTLTWRVGPQHKQRELDPSEDYPANYVQPVDLLVGDGDGAGPGARTVQLGALAGSVEPSALTYCRGRGFRQPRDESDWLFPSEPSIAAAFSLGVPQGDSTFLLARDGDVLHLLHRETSDGRCDEIRQGPLAACEGFEYERVADIRLPRGAALYEIVLDEGAPFECGVDRYGSALVPPPR